MGKTVKLGDVVVDTEKGTAMKNNKDLFLSALEYRLLLFFINNRGIVLTRERLLDAIWDAAGEYVNDNTLTVYIKRLREKICLLYTSRCVYETDRQSRECHSSTSPSARYRGRYARW